MKRILLAGILGGLTLFVWMFVVHELLGLGEREDLDPEDRSLRIDGHHERLLLRAHDMRVLP